MSKCAGDYDLKVMRQEYYIHRQKVVCFFILYCGWLSKFSSLRLFGAIEHTDKRTSGLSASWHQLSCFEAMSNTEGLFGP